MLKDYYKPMPASFVVANWKANKTEEEAVLWLKRFEELFRANPPDLEHKEIVVCPPHHLLSVLFKYVTRRNQELPIHLGSQDVSQFGRGAYTGEVPMSLIRDYANYCIIGHSERRNYFHEDDEILQKKVSLVDAGHCKTIFCVPNPDTFIPQEVVWTAYEPVEAIGTGKPEDPAEANRIAQEIKQKNPQVKYVLYGGSVTPENVHEFTKLDSIDGVLVGGASLDADKFYQLIINA